MRSRVFIAALAVSLVVTAPSGAALAQPAEAPEQAGPPPPLTLSYVDGRVDVVRPAGVDAARAPDLLEEDDRLVVADGRAEIVFDSGPVAHLDRDTDIRVDLGVRLRLVRGRLILHTLATDAALVVATPAGLVELAPEGEYHLTADDLQGDTEVAVLRGHAIVNAPQRETIREGEAVRIDPRDRRARWARGVFADAFSDWSQRRIASFTTESGPDDVLPPAARPWAADFARYGTWGAVDPYGPVWFPRRGPDWRPYVDGTWRHTGYGWSWIDTDPWAWPLHHYGRWGRHQNRGWYWIPHRRWAPAWVGWAVAADHVAWAPLGWNARPVVDFFAGVRLGPVGAWASSWSILPRGDFGRRGRVRPYLRDPGLLPGPVLGGFVSQMVGPRGPADTTDRFRRGAGPRDVPYRPSTTDPRPGSRPGRDAVERRPNDAPGPDGWGRRPVDAPARRSDRRRDGEVDPGRQDSPANDIGPGRRRDAGAVAPVGAPVPPRRRPGDAADRDAAGPTTAGGASPSRGPRDGGRRAAPPTDTGDGAGASGTRRVTPGSGAVSGGGGAPRGPGRGGSAAQGGRRSPSAAGAGSGGSSARPSGSGRGTGASPDASARGARPRRN